ncbi:S8/S53 family peptidase [Amycolatopsis sp. GM8]|uniref:S8 family peptidase n=1 Tax=Amycolatopsis sp. GM8 TaxID=2896530 RepID=UPI001F31AD68|nr:S8/S53 family peptidase [Amycolatopsis sp. GM8]
MLIQVGPALHHSDQLVVDLGQLGFVLDLLDELGVKHSAPGPGDQDELLGLARLRDLTEADGSDLEVGDVLAVLRQQAAARRDGFIPPMGRNRVVEAVIGDGHKPMALGEVGSSGHKPMAGADPQPVDASQLPDVSMIAADAGKGVHVGLVDTPVPPVRPGTPDNPLPYRAGHGEFVASLIRRQAPAAEVTTEGALDPETGRADSWDIARAILRLVTTGQLDILNLSLGCYTLDGPPLVMTRAIERLGDRVLVIAAAGNHGDFAQLAGGRTARSGSWPAAIPPVIAIGAAEDDGTTASFSPKLSWVSCTAPGVGVVGSYLTGEVRTSTGDVRFDGLARWSGTSFAAATVSGAVAARTVPGSVTPRQALAGLLAEGTLVRPFAEAR